MSSGFLDITQELDINKYPFRQNRLDYSHLESAEVLDAIAASLLLWLLTASFVHLIALLHGMTVRSVLIRSLLERFIPTDIIGVSRLFSEGDKNEPRSKNYRISQVIAGSVLALLLVVDLLVIFSGSLRQKQFKLEDFQIKIPQFAPYEGEVRYSKIRDNSFPLISSGQSVSFHPLTFRILEVKSPMEKLNVISVIFAYMTNTNAVIAHCYAEKIATTWTITVEALGDFENSRLLVIRPRDILNDTKKMAIWTGRHLKSIYGCSKETLDEDPLGGSSELATDAKGSYIYACENSFSGACNGTFNEIILGTLSLSNSMLSRQDFVPHTVNDTVSYQTVNVSNYAVWDRFAEFRTSRVPGYILWLCVFGLLIINILLGCLAPDIQLVWGVALAQCLHLESIPARLQRHIHIKQERANLDI